MAKIIIYLMFDFYFLYACSGYIYLYYMLLKKNKKINCKEMIWGHLFVLNLLALYRINAVKLNGKTYRENDCQMPWKN